MSLILNIVQVVQLLAALGMIGLILVQHGKGADMGAAFGSGSSCFFVATLLLAFLGSRPQVGGAGIMDQVPASTKPITAPVGDAPPAEPAKAPAQSSQIPK